VKVRCISNLGQLENVDDNLYLVETGQWNDLVIGKCYEVIEVQKGWYRIIDESGDDYLYPPELFAQENG
jgi:hypothetical protein